MYRHLLILSFTLSTFACAPRKNFSADTAKAELLKVKPEPELEKPEPKKPDPEKEKPDPSPTAVTVAKTCEDPGAKLETIVQDIKFPERTDPCRFGEAPNVEQKQQIVTASESQSVDLNLPKGTICTMNISSVQDTKLLYDDFIILTLDDHILFASHKGTTLYMERKDGILDWDFENVVNRPVGNWGAQAFCLGKPAKLDPSGKVLEAGDCQLPPTEKTGPFKMDLSAQSISPIAVAIQGKTSVPMKLIVTGDNDIEKDCHHTELDLKATIKYLPK